MRLFARRASIRLVRERFGGFGGYGGVTGVEKSDLD